MKVWKGVFEKKMKYILEVTKIYYFWKCTCTKNFQDIRKKFQFSELIITFEPKNLNFFEIFCELFYDVTRKLS